MHTDAAKALEPAYLWVFRLSAGIGWALVSLIPAVVLTGVLDLAWYLGVLIGLGVFVLLMALFYGYSIHWYRRYRYELTAEGLVISKGVFWRSTVMVPRNRVQHVDITTGPLERRHDLSKLVLHTAGTSNASVTLPGLLHADAAALRQDLINQDQTEDTV